MIKLTLKIVAEDSVIDDLLRIVQDNLKGGHVSWAEAHLEAEKKR